MSEPRLIADLLRRAAYSHPVGTVGLVQTHISYVLLAGDFAYKIKKPLDLGFLDYTTLERRRQMCEAEVRLNRRLCDGVYLGVVPVTLDASGRHRLGGGGAAVEFAVQMRRVSEERTMPSLLAKGRIERSHLAALAAKLATFHATAASNERVADYGRVRAVRANWEENFEQSERFVGRTLSRPQLENVRDYVDMFVDSHRDLIEKRADRGCVRDGHGDLRADSVVFAPEASICVMDCIEFNERLRCGDIASEVAFLAMDLEFRGHRREADEFVGLYLEALGTDETFPVVFNFYRTYRAFVRGKVDSMLTDQMEVPETQRAQAADRATRYFGLASTWAEARYPQQLVLMCGLSGTGKSFIARALASRLGAVLISTDAVRRQIMDGATPGSYGEGAYAADERELVYDEMLGRARHHLDRGRSVLLDGTFLARAQRAAARDVATSAGVPLLVIQTVAGEEVVRGRLNARTLGTSASDARWDTYLEQKKHFEPLDDVPAAQLVMLDSSQPLDRLLDRVMVRSRQHDA